MQREAGCDLVRVIEAAVEAERETAAERTSRSLSHAGRAGRRSGSTPR